MLDIRNERLAELEAAETVQRRPRHDESCEHLGRGPARPSTRRDAALRGLRRGRAPTGCTCGVPGVRPRGLLRLLAAAARQRALRRHRPPGDALGRAGRGPGAGASSTAGWAARIGGHEDHQVRALLRAHRARRPGRRHRPRRVHRARGRRRRDRGAGHPRARRPLDVEHLRATDAPVFTIEAVRAQIAEPTRRRRAGEVVAPGEQFDVGLPVTAVGELHAVIHPDLPRFDNSGFVLDVAGTRSTTPATPSRPPAGRSTYCCCRCARRGARCPRSSTSPATVGAPRSLAIHDGLLSDAGLAVARARPVHGAARLRRAARYERRRARQPT